MAASTHQLLREALRPLLLPVAPEAEEAAVAAADEVLAKAGVDEGDRAVWVRNAWVEWRESGAADATFAKVVAAFVAASGDDIAAALAGAYLWVHQDIRERPLFDHDRASALLSHGRLIARLAQDDAMSAAQVARLVNARDPRLQVAWPVIRDVLAAVGLKPALDQGQVEALDARDVDLEVEAFADADDETAIAIVARAGEELGFGPGLADALAVLLPPGEEPFGPYLQILHYQCVIAEFYDHLLSVLYEFNPRGAVAAWLFDRYPQKLIGAGNPFLNNAKSVDVLHRDWAQSKKAAQARQAHALVTVIAGLDRMGYAARKELAGWLRRLILRCMRLAEGAHHVLPPALSEQDAAAVLDAIAAGESGTQGIVEQRLIDAISVHRHPSPTWVGRGLGDSVNATNVSRRKLGDCDFQDAGGGRVVAYEAHAGRLSGPYVSGHVFTLKKTLLARIEEWEENFGAGRPWSVEVVFVAHELDLGPGDLPAFAVGEVNVQTRAVTYEELLRGLAPPSTALLALMEEHVLGPMSQPRTPDAARAALLGMFGV